jgi:hypothetical protein
MMNKFLLAAIALGTSIARVMRLMPTPSARCILPSVAAAARR